MVSTLTPAVVASSSTRYRMSNHSTSDHSHWHRVVAPCGTLVRVTAQQPTPDLTPVTYWPSRRAGEPDRAWCETRRDVIRRFAGPGLGLVLTQALVFAAVAIQGARGAWIIV